MESSSDIKTSNKSFISNLESLYPKDYNEGFSDFDRIESISIDEYPDFKDPFDLIDHLQLNNNSAIKLIPSKDFSNEFNLNLQNFQFKLINQKVIDPSFINNEDRIKFYKKLIQYHNSRNVPLLKLPSIDRKFIDLYSLNKIVDEKGGFDSVCKKKLWAQIGRELGYNGKVMTSLSSTLRIVYIKHLSDLNKFDFDEPPLKKIKLNDEKRVLNSNNVFTRQKDILKAKGLNSNFDSYTIEKQNITVSDSITYPLYDSNFWHKGLEINDYQFKDSVDFNFRDFYLKNSNNELLKNSDLDKYSLFWSKLQSNEFSSETSMDLNSITYGSGFDSNLANPWNFNNLKFNSKNLLRFLNTDNNSITNSNLKINNLFSINNWSLEDHFLNLIDYNHFGFNKVWFFIDKSDNEKFETLLTDLLNKNKDGDTEENYKNYFNDYLSEPSINDVFKHLDQFNDSIRSNTNDPKFNQLFNKSLNNNLNSNLILSPEFLKSKGIKIKYMIQKHGEFIIKFPEVYSFNLSFGISISESLNFANLNWLNNNALNSEKWLIRNSILPNFSYFQLLISIIEESKDPILLKNLQDNFNNLIEFELKLRNNLKLKFNHLKLINNKFDFICDDTLKNEFPTKLIINDNNDNFILDSLKFLNDDNNDELIKTFPKFELHVFYSDDKLKNLLKTLSNFSQTPKDWLNKYTELLNLDSSSDEFIKPSLKNLKNLLTDCEKFDKHIEESNWLFNYIEKNYVYVEKAQDLLAAKQSNRIRNKKLDDKKVQIQKDLSILNELILMIPKLDFNTPEFDQIFDLYDEILSYEISVKAFLKEDHTIEEFYDMIDLGKSFGVQLNSIKILEKIISRKELINRYDEIINEFNETSNEPKQLDEFKKILDEFHLYGNDEDFEKIKNLRNIVRIGEFFDLKINHELGDKEALNILKIDEFIRISCENPIYSKTIKDLEDLKNDHLTAIAEKNDLIFRIQATVINPDRLSKKVELKLDGSAYSDEVNKALREYYYDLKDIRPTYSEVRDIVEKAKELSPKTEFVEPLDHYLRADEDWLRSCKKIFGKANAPFNVLKGHLSVLANKITYSLNLNDLYQKDLPDKMHLTYCICRRPESGVMISCEKCNEWYHCKCLKLGRGKTKFVDKFVCPICDYRVEYPKEYNSPKLEDIRRLLDESYHLVLCPDELNSVRIIYQHAYEYNAYLKQRFDRLEDENKPIPSDIPVEELKYLLRKLEGSTVLMVKEYNDLRQAVWEKDPCCYLAPPLISSSEKTKKRRKKIEFLPPIGNFQNSVVQLASAAIDAVPEQITVPEKVEDKVEVKEVMDLVKPVETIEPMANTEPVKPVETTESVKPIETTELIEPISEAIIEVISQPVEPVQETNL